MLTPENKFFKEHSVMCHIPFKKVKGEVAAFYKNTLSIGFHVSSVSTSEDKQSPATSIEIRKCPIFKRWLGDPQTRKECRAPTSFPERLGSTYKPWKPPSWENKQSLSPATSYKPLSKEQLDQYLSAVLIPWRFLLSCGTLVHSSSTF